MKIQLNKQTIINTILPIISTLAVAGLVYAAWTEPTATPPNDNVAAPINISDNTQYKSGALGIGGVFQAFSSVFLATNPGTKVGIGTTSPDTKLDIVGGKAQADDFCLQDNSKCLSTSGTGGMGDNFHFTTVSAEGITDFPILPRSMWAGWAGGRATYLVEHYGGWGQTQEDGAIALLDKNKRILFKMQEGATFSGTLATTATVTDKNNNTITSFPNQGQDAHYVIVLFKNAPDVVAIRSQGAPPNISNPTTFKNMTVVKLGSGSIDFPKPPDLGTYDNFYTVTFR